ncbi:unnamed protein product, partial [Didymodactylos carnosus]
NTAVGHDGVHNKCLKKYTKTLLQHLLASFNSSLKLGVISPQWKLAHIILIQKPDKDPNDPTTYRLISLLSCLGKLMERVVKQRLNDFAEQHHLLPNYQAGFRQQRSTTDNLLHLKHDVDVNLYKNRQTALIVFDIKQAFNSVWFNGLLYSDSLSTILSRSNSNLFADDTALWSSVNTTKSLSIRLQESVDEFVKWCRLWKLEIQANKTKMIHFTKHPRRRLKVPISIIINGQQIQQHDTVKYLEIVFDRQMRFNKQIDEIKRKASTRLGVLRYLAKNSADNSERALLTVCKNIVRLVLSYASPIFWNVDQNYWEKLQIIQNKGLRHALRVPFYTSGTYVHQQLQQETIFDYCKRQPTNYLNKRITEGTTRAMQAFAETISYKHVIKLPLTVCCPSSGNN